MILDAERLFGETAIVKITSHGWTNRVGTTLNEDHTRGEWHLLVDPKEFKGINSKTTRLRTLLGTVFGTRFSLFDGCYLIRKTRLKEAITAIQHLRYEFLDEVGKFVEERYQPALQEALANGRITAEEFTAAPPADTLWKKFNITYATFIVSVPSATGDKEVDALVKAGFAEELNLSFGGATEQLYDELDALLATAMEPLFDNTCKKRVLVSHYENLEHWIDRLADRNFLADATLLAVSQELTRQLAGFDLDGLRKDGEQRAALAVALKVLREQLAKGRRAGPSVLLD
jgi:hypothetical protein